MDGVNCNYLKLKELSPQAASPAAPLRGAVDGRSDESGADGPILVFLKNDRYS